MCARACTLCLCVSLLAGDKGESLVKKKCLHGEKTQQLFADGPYFVKVTRSKWKFIMVLKLVNPLMSISRSWPACQCLLS